MVDGAITLWDPVKIMDGPTSMDNLRAGKGCVSATQIHGGVEVGAIEFNPHKKNLLASGGAEVLIQDISANIKTPSVFKPGVPNYHEGSRITAISWNRVVPHILASASENGKIVVWDLKVPTDQQVERAQRSANLRTSVTVRSRSRETRLKKSRQSYGN